MNKTPDLEKIIEIILSYIGSSEKPLVELYLNNPDALSPEYREKAAGMIKQFMEKYPELSQKYTETKELHPNLRKFKYDLTALKTKYGAWRDEIKSKMTAIDLKSCCIDAMQEYSNALDRDIDELKIREQQLIDLESISTGELDLKEEQQRWHMLIEEKNNRFKAMQKRYQRNDFAKEGEWKIVHMVEGHYKPLSHDKYEDW